MSAPHTDSNAGVRVAQQIPYGRPFIERRRRADIHHSWPEALDCIHRHLLGMQSVNEQLSESEEKHRLFFENAPIGLFQSTPGGQPVLMNAAMAHLLGYESTERAFEAFVNGTSPLLLDPSRWRIRTESRGNDFRDGIEFQVQYSDGARKWLRFHVHTIRERGRIAGYLGTGEDITRLKQAEMRTEFLAYYDPLTGLPNRTSFFKQFAEILVAAHERQGRAALMLVEFDRFKFINDSLGDQFGDRLLQEIAARIKAAAGSRAAVARMGGAEFAIILRNPGTVAAIRATAQTVATRLQSEYCLLGHSLTLFCNIGISIFPDHGTDCETLMKRADAAICSARVDGGNCIRVFSAQLNDQIQERLTLENGLGEALKRNELYLEYQPQVDMRTGSVTGLEALLRWNHKEMGLISPNRFIGIAENCGLIVPIGEWVLRSACYQARQWKEKGCPFESVAVNVSAVQFRQQGFCEVVRRILKETCLRPELLELELTESLLLSNADVMSTVIGELRGMGVRVAIDDFGTGYSSLGYLKQFKVNRLKIARSFVQDVSIDGDDAAITTAIIEMAKAMNLSVLAEGVENEAQLSFLWSQQCYTIQGFYFSRPIGVQKIDSQLRTGFRHLIPAEFSRVERG